MKLICIKNGFCALSIGKEYNTCQLKKDKFWWVVNDDQISFPYPVEWFITLEEYRNQKLRELGL